MAEEKVLKEDAFPKPDEKQLYADGVPREVAFFIRTAYDTLPKTPVPLITPEMADGLAQNKSELDRLQAEEKSLLYHIGTLNAGNRENIVPDFSEKYGSTPEQAQESLTALTRQKEETAQKQREILQEAAGHGQEIFLQTVGAVYAEIMKLRTMDDCRAFSAKIEEMRSAGTISDIFSAGFRTKTRLADEYDEAVLHSAMEKEDFLLSDREKALKPYSIYRYDGTNVHKDAEKPEYLVIETGKDAKYSFFAGEKMPDIDSWQKDTWFVCHYDSRQHEENDDIILGFNFETREQAEDIAWRHAQGLPIVEKREEIAPEIAEPVAEERPAETPEKAQKAQEQSVQEADRETLSRIQRAADEVQQKKDIGNKVQRIRSMKERFAIPKNLMLLEETIRDRKPYVTFTISTTGLDREKDQITRIYAQEYRFDDRIQQYMPGIGFDHMLQCSPEALARAETSEYDVFASAGIDREAYKAGNGVDSMETFSDKFGKFVHALHPETAVIANNTEFIFPFLEKIQLEQIFTQARETCRLIDQTTMTGEYFRVHGIREKNSLENLNLVMHPEGEQSEFAGTDKRGAVLHAFAAYFGREKGLLESEAEAELRQKEADISDFYAREGRKKYQSASLGEKMQMLISKGSVEPSAVMVRDGDCELNRFRDILEQKNGNSGFSVIHVHTTGFNAGNMPIQASAVCYAFQEDGTPTAQKSISNMTIRTAERYIQEAEQDKKFDVFGYAGFAGVEDYRKKAEKSGKDAEQAIGRLAKFFKAYPPEDYPVLVIGNTTRESLQQIGNLSIFDSNVIDFVHVLQQELYREHMNGQYSLIDRENADSLKKLGFREILEASPARQIFADAETGESRLPVNTKEMCTAVAGFTLVLMDTFAFEKKQEAEAQRTGRSVPEMQKEEAVPVQPVQEPVPVPESPEKKNQPDMQEQSDSVPAGRQSKQEDKHDKPAGQPQQDIPAKQEPVQKPVSPEKESKAPAREKKTGWGTGWTFREESPQPEKPKTPAPVKTPYAQGAGQQLRQGGGWGSLTRKEQERPQPDTSWHISGKKVTTPAPAVTEQKNEPAPAKTAEPEKSKSESTIEKLREQIGQLSEIVAGLQEKVDSLQAENAELRERVTAIEVQRNEERGSVKESIEQSKNGNKTA